MSDVMCDERTYYNAYDETKTSYKQIKNQHQNLKTKNAPVFIPFLT